MTDERSTTDETRHTDGLRAATVQAADTLVDTRPDHGLDSSPASLARLDPLVADTDPESPPVTSVGV